MTESKQRLFIYDRREMGVLVFLALAVAVFAFTLGVHLGKRVGPKPLGEAAEPSSIGTVNDKVPNRQEIQEQSKNVQQVMDETLSQTLHDEVARTGVKLDVQRQVDLPRQTKSRSAGATTLAPNSPVNLEEASSKPKAAEKQPESHGAASEHAASEHATKPAHGEESHAQASTGAHAEAPKEKAHAQAPVAAEGEGDFTLQIGSYDSEDGARERMSSMESQGFKPTLQVAQLKGKGKWYRVYIGRFRTKEEAERAGAKYRGQNLIQSFLVAKVKD